MKAIECRRLYSNWPNPYSRPRLLCGTLAGQLGVFIAYRSVISFTINTLFVTESVNDIKTVWWIDYLTAIFTSRLTPFSLSFFSSVLNRVVLIFRPTRPPDTKRESNPERHRGKYFANERLECYTLPEVPDEAITHAPNYIINIIYYLYLKN